MAYQRFFKKISDHPRFHSRHNNHQSVQYPQNVKIDIEQIQIKKSSRYRIRMFVSLPKMDKIKMDAHRRLPVGKVCTCTVSKTPTGKFFISVLVDDFKDPPKSCAVSTETAIGVDLGIKDLAILSDGTKIGNPHYLKKSLKRLALLQRRACKKAKGSNNRKRANLRVARMHEKVANQRKDFNHKLSHKIISENQTICLETLMIKNMVKNHKLARSIQDCSWYQLTSFLEYKAEWYGRNVVRIPTFAPSSKKCSVCGYINNELTLADRSWTCPKCGTHHDRDTNAACSIKETGLEIARKSNKYTFLSEADHGLKPIRLPKHAAKNKQVYVFQPLIFGRGW